MNVTGAAISSVAGAKGKVLFFFYGFSPETVGHPSPKRFQERETQAGMQRYS